LLSAACGDDKAATIVNDDISWHIGCASASGCGLYASHIQEAVGQNFRVSCNRSKTTGINITLTDPGFAGSIEESPRPPSTIVIANGDPASQSCNVTVREASDYNFAPETWQGMCVRSGGDCVLSGGALDGFDFKGTLICPTLLKTATGSAATYELGSGNDTSVPIKLEIDNCD